MIDSKPNRVKGPKNIKNLGDKEYVPKLSTNFTNLPMTINYLGFFMVILTYLKLINKSINNYSCQRCKSLVEPMKRPLLAALSGNSNELEINFKDADDELDKLSIRILELMNEHIECKVNLERAVRSGCIDLAKTRYIQGKTQVSATNIPTDDLAATKTVVLSTTEEGNHTFELKDVTSNDNTIDNSKKNKQDPLRWFGILVPSNLRQSQAWFLKAIDLSVQSANISANIIVSVEKFEKLIGTKKLLKDRKEVK